MPRQQPSGRAGITLVEVLVTLSLISLLIGLLLPGIQAARESARRARCASNLRQIGLALLGYEASHGVLPPGRMMNYDPRYSGGDPPCTTRIVEKSALARILPWAEQTALYNAMNQDVSIFARENRTAHTATIGLYACPSDPESGRPRPGYMHVMVREGFAASGESLDMVFTSYAVSSGSFYVSALPRSRNGCLVPGPLAAQADGAMPDMASVRLSSITDGLSQTLFMVERSTTDLWGLDATNPDLFPWIGWWFEGNWKTTMATTMFPPNMIAKVGPGAGLRHGSAAASMHPGGLNALMGDGSVRFISDSIDSWPSDRLTGTPIGALQTPEGWWINLPRRGVWQALGSRSGGEVVDAASF